MNIRRATHGDLDDVMRIYDAARAIMRQSGNRVQWVNGYPQRRLVESDIANDALYVIEGDDGKAHAAFMFVVGDDPSYARIDDGAWLDDDPYGVIHRIGSDGTLRGVLRSALGYCTREIPNIRIDTHADNAIMRHALEKEGFLRCGTIYCHDNTPRIAYQLHEERPRQAL